jgi:heme A synthase
MIVEFTHRITSALSGLLVLVELVWAFVAFPKRHPARAGAAAAMFFMLNEGAVGAALVLLEHVAYDQSVARAAWVSLHLANTFFLVAAMTCTAYWGSTGKRATLAGQGVVPALVGLGAVGLVLVGVSGAVAALGDTLFKAPSLAQGIADDFAPRAHFLQQLRVVHPALAVGVALFVLYARASIAAGRGADAARFSRLVAALVVGQLLLGLVNLVLRAPIAMQVAHLLAADLVWIAFVLLGAAALASGDERAVEAVTRPDPLADA